MTMNKIGVVALAMALMACGVQAKAQSLTWTLAESDSSGALAYVDAGDGNLTVAARLGQPAPLDGAPDFSGFIVTVKPDCTAMNEVIVSMVYYAADKSVTTSGDSGGKAQTIDTGGDAGPDDLVTARCQGKALPALETYTGDANGVQDWLDAEMAKKAAAGT